MIFCSGDLVVTAFEYGSDKDHSNFEVEPLTYYIFLLWH